MLTTQMWILLTIYYCWEMDSGTTDKNSDSEKYESGIKQSADIY